MLEHLAPHRCLPLDSIVRKGDVGDELFLIKNGLFEVLNEDRTVHRMLGPGSYFGEVALLCHVHRTMTVRAVSHALVFVLERKHFVPLMSEYPADFRQLQLSAALRYRSKPRPAYLVGDDGLRSTAPRKNSITERLLGAGGKLSVGKASAHLDSILKGLAQDGTHASQERRGIGGVLPHVLPSFTEGLGPRLAAGRRMIAALVDRSVHDLSLATDERGSQTAGTASTDSHDPLAFMATGTDRDSFTEIRKDQQLTSIAPTPAEMHSRLQDREILNKMVEKAKQAPRKASLEIAQNEEDVPLPSEARKSVVFTDGSTPAGRAGSPAFRDGQATPSPQGTPLASPKGSFRNENRASRRFSFHASNTAVLEAALERDSVTSIDETSPTPLRPPAAAAGPLSGFGLGFYDA
jgi:CRP-like cAMP-binding protein